jgi:ribosomal protein S18 acetylase RimI-like enzyme
VTLSPVVSLRAVSSDDKDFLLRVFASTRAAELALTGWDAATCDAFVRMQCDAQSVHYRQQWPASDHLVIEVAAQQQAEAVGRLWVNRGDQAIHVLDIALLPEWRNRAIGSGCLARLMQQAASTTRQLSIHVEQGNPARRLYDRLGFRPVGPQRGLHQLMTWSHHTGPVSPREEQSYEEA